MKTKNEIMREVAEQRIRRARVADTVALICLAIEVVFFGCIFLNSMFSIIAMLWLVVMFAYIDKASHLEEMAKRDIQLMDEEGE